MDECICLKGITFDRKYFHSAVLIRGTDPSQEQYFGNLVLSLNFLVPFIGGNQGILKTMSFKETTPIETIDMYRGLLEKLQVGLSNTVTRAELIEELLTADEKALSKGAPISGQVRDIPESPTAFEATEEEKK